MKLVYMWIESYQFIKNQGYLLNSDYDVQFDHRTGVLKIRENTGLDCMLYGDKISITAIVGNNGAGKSTLLDLIRIILFDKQKRKQVKGFLLFEEKEKLYLLNMAGMRAVPARSNKIVWTEVEEPWGSFALVYYSDFLDIKYYGEEFDDDEGEGFWADGTYYPRNRDAFQINVSTPYLIRKCEGRMLDFFHEDIKRQLRFYEYAKNKGKEAEWLPFKLPERLTVTVAFQDMRIFDTVLDHELGWYHYRGQNPYERENNTDSYVIGLLKRMEDIYNERLTNKQWNPAFLEILRWDIFAAYVYELLSDRRQEHENSDDDYSGVDTILRQMISIEGGRREFYEQLRNIFSSEMETVDRFKPYLDFYNKITDFIMDQESGDFHIQLFMPDVLRTDWKQDEGWEISTNMEWFMEVFDSYEEIAYEVDSLKFSWGMSSGENSLFLIFARLNEALEAGKTEKAMMLLLDELDSSFHPQWQQRIIRSLADLCKEKNKDKDKEKKPEQTFQIFITTHSPVVLSDLPKENVVFMKENGCTTTEHEQTFAANISSLYYDSFFMEKGSIGEASRNCIINLIEAIEETEKICRDKKAVQSQYSDRTEILLRCFCKKQGVSCQVKKGEAKDLLQKLIDSIGEPIWRYKIDEKFHSLLKNRSSGSEEKEIREKIDELRQKQGSESVRKLLGQLLEEER